MVLRQTSDRELTYRRRRGVWRGFREQDSNRHVYRGTSEAAGTAHRAQSIGAMEVAMRRALIPIEDRTLRERIINANL